MCVSIIEKKFLLQMSLSLYGKPCQVLNENND